MNSRIVYLLPVLIVLLLLSFSVLAQDEVIGGVLTPEYTCARQNVSGGGFICGGTCPENQECKSDIASGCSCQDIPIARRACGFYNIKIGEKFQGICGGQCPSGESCSDKFGGCECVDNDILTEEDIVIGGSGGTGTTTTGELDYCLDCSFCKDDCRKDCVIRKLFGKPSYQPETDKSKALSILANKNLRYCPGPPDSDKVENTNLYLLDQTWQNNGDFQQYCSANDKERTLKAIYKSCRKECGPWSECIASGYGNGKQTRECKWVGCENVPACLQEIVPEPGIEERYCRPKFDGTGLIGGPYIENLTEWRKNQTAAINKTRKVKCEVLGDITDTEGNIAGIACTIGTCPAGKICGVQEIDENGFKRTGCGCVDETSTSSYIGQVDREALRKQWLIDQYNRTGKIPGCQDTGMAPPNQAPICGGGCGSANRKCLTQVFDYDLGGFVPLELANYSHNLGEFNCGCVSTGRTVYRRDYDGTEENIIDDIEEDYRSIDRLARKHTVENNITDCRYLGTVEAKGYPSTPICSQGPGICAPGTYCNLNTTGESYSCGCQPLVFQKDENTTDADIDRWRKKSTLQVKSKLGNVSCEQIGWIQNVDGTKEIACASGEGICQSGASCVPQGDGCGCEFPVFKDPPIQGPKTPKGSVVWGEWNKTGEVPKCGRPINGVCGGYCPDGQVCGVNATGSKYADKGYELWCSCVAGEPGEWDGTKEDLTKKAEDFKRKQEQNNTNNFENWVLSESIKAANKSQDLSCYQVGWREDRNGKREIVCSSIAFCPAKNSAVPVNSIISIYGEEVKGCTVRYDVQRSASGVFSIPKCSCEGPTIAPPTIFYNRIGDQINEEVETGKEGKEIIDSISKLPKEIAAEDLEEVQRRLDHIISLLINISQKKIRGEVDIPNDIIIGYINKISSVAQDDSLRALFVEILTKLGEFDEAKKHAFLTMNPNVRQALIIQIATAMKDSDNEGANSLFDLVIETINTTNSPETQLAVATIKIQKGGEDLEDARKILIRLLQSTINNETKRIARHYLDQIDLTAGRGINIVSELTENVERIESIELLGQEIREAKEKYDQGLISIDEYAEIILKYYTRQRRITISLTENEINHIFLILQKLRSAAADKRIKLSQEQKDDLINLIQRIENFIISSINERAEEIKNSVGGLDPDKENTESHVFGAELKVEFLERILNNVIIGKNVYQDRDIIEKELRGIRDDIANQVDSISAEIKKLEREIEETANKKKWKFWNWVNGQESVPWEWNEDEKIEELTLRVRKLYNKLRVAQARLRIHEDAIRDNFEDRSPSELQQEYQRWKDAIYGYYNRGNGRWERGVADELDLELPNTDLPDIFTSSLGKTRDLITKLRNYKNKMKSAFIAWKMKELNITRPQALILWWQTEEERAKRLEKVTNDEIEAKNWFERNFISGDSHLKARLSRLNSERIDRFGDIVRNLDLFKNDPKSLLTALSIMQEIKNRVGAKIFDERFGNKWRRGPVQLWWSITGRLQENADLIINDLKLSFALEYAARVQDAGEIKKFNEEYYDLLVKAGFIQPQNLSLSPGEEFPDSAKNGIIELDLNIEGYTSIFFRFKNGRWEWKAPPGFDEYSEWRLVDSETRVPGMHDKYWNVINALKGKSYEEGILIIAKALSDQRVGVINLNLPGKFVIPENLRKSDLTELGLDRILERSIVDDFINPVQALIDIPTILIPGAIAYRVGNVVTITTRNLAVRFFARFGLQNRLATIILGRTAQGIGFAAGAATEGSVFHGLSSAAQGHIDTNLENYWHLIKFFGVLKIGNLAISPLARIVERAGTRIELPEIIVKVGTRGTLLTGEIGSLTLADILTADPNDENQLSIGQLLLKNGAMVVQLKIARRLAGLSPFMGDFLDHGQNEEVQRLIEEQQRLNREIAEVLKIYSRETEEGVVIEVPEVVAREILQKNQRRIEQIRNQILGIYKQNGLDFLIVEDATLDARAKKAIDASIGEGSALRVGGNPLLRAKIVRLLVENKNLDKAELAEILKNNGITEREANRIAEIFLEGPFIVNVPEKAPITETPDSKQLRNILRRLSKAEDAEKKAILEEAKEYLEALEPTLRENLQVAEIINVIDTIARERSIDLSVVSLGSISEANNENKLLGDVLIEVRNKILKERFGNKYKELTRNKGVLIGITEPVLRQFLEEYSPERVRELIIERLREKIENLPEGKLKLEVQDVLERLSLAKLKIDTKFDIGNNKIIISPETSEAEARVKAYKALEEANARNEEADGLKTDAALNPEKGLLFLDAYKVIVYENGKRVFKKVPKDVIIILDAESLLEEFARLRGEIILLLEKAERGELTEVEKQLLRDKLEEYENELKRIDDIAKRDKRHPEFINDKSSIREYRNNRNKIFDEVRDPVERAKRLAEVGLEENGLIVFKAGDEIGISYIVVDSEGRAVLDAEGNIIEKFITIDIDNFDAFVEKANELGLSGTKDFVYHRILDMILDTVRDGISRGNSDSRIMQDIQKRLSEITLEFDTKNPKHREYLDGLGISYTEGQKVVIRLDQFKFPLTEKLSKLKEKIVKLRIVGNNKKADQLQALIDSQTPKGKNPPSRIFLGEDGFVLISESSRTLSSEENILIVFDQEQNRISEAKKESKGVLLPEDERVCTPERCVPAGSLNLPRNQYPKAHEKVVRKMIANMPEFEGMSVEVKDRTIIDNGDGVYEWIYSIYIDGEFALTISRTIDHNEGVIKFNNIEVSEDFRGNRLAERIYNIELSLFRKLGLDYETFSDVTHEVTTELQVRKNGAVLDKTKAIDNAEHRNFIVAVLRREMKNFFAKGFVFPERHIPEIISRMLEQKYTTQDIIISLYTTLKERGMTTGDIVSVLRHNFNREEIVGILKENKILTEGDLVSIRHDIFNKVRELNDIYKTDKERAYEILQEIKKLEEILGLREDYSIKVRIGKKEAEYRPYKRTVTGVEVEEGMKRLEGLVYEKLNEQIESGQEPSIVIRISGRPGSGKSTISSKIEAEGIAATPKDKVLVLESDLFDDNIAVIKKILDNRHLLNKPLNELTDSEFEILMEIVRETPIKGPNEEDFRKNLRNSENTFLDTYSITRGKSITGVEVIVVEGTYSSRGRNPFREGKERIEGDINVYVSIEEAERFERIRSRGGQEVETFVENADVENTLHRYGVDMEADIADIVIDNSKIIKPLKAVEFEIKTGPKVLQEIRNELRQAIGERDVARFLAAKTRLRNLFLQGEITNSKYQKMVPVIEEIYKDIVARMSVEEMRQEAQRIINELRGTEEEKSQLIEGELADLIIENAQEISLKERFVILKELFEKEDIDISAAISDLQLSLIVKGQTGKNFIIDVARFEQARKKLGIDRSKWNIVLQQFKLRLIQELVNKKRGEPAVVETTGPKTEVASPTSSDLKKYVQSENIIEFLRKSVRDKGTIEDFDSSLEILIKNDLLPRELVDRIKDIQENTKFNTQTGEKLTEAEKRVFIFREVQNHFFRNLKADLHSELVDFLLERGDVSKLRDIYSKFESLFKIAPKEETLRDTFTILTNVLEKNGYAVDNVIKVREGEFVVSQLVLDIIDIITGESDLRSNGMFLRLPLTDSQKSKMRTILKSHGLSEKAVTNIIDSIEEGGVLLVSSFAGPSTLFHERFHKEIGNNPTLDYYFSSLPTEIREVITEYMESVGYEPRIFSEEFWADYFAYKITGEGRILKYLTREQIEAVTSIKYTTVYEDGTTETQLILEDPSIKEIENKVRDDIDLSKFRENYKEAIEGSDVIVPSEVAAERTAVVDRSILDSLNALKDVRDEVRQAVMEKDVARLLATKDELATLFFESKITKEQYDKASAAVDAILKDLAVKELRNVETREIMLRQLKENVKINTIVDYLREAGKENPEILIEIGRITKFGRDTISKVLIDLAKEQGKVKILGKNEHIARIYKTSKKGEEIKRKDKNIGWPIVIIGEVYEKDGRALSVAEVERKYGLEAIKDNNGRPLFLTVKSTETGGRIVYIDQPITVVLAPDGTVKSVHFGLIEDTREIEGFTKGDKLVHGNALEIKGAGTTKFSGVTYIETQMTEAEFQDLWSDATKDWSEEAKQKKLDNINKQSELGLGSRLNDDIHVKKVIDKNTGEFKHYIITRKETLKGFSEKSVGMYPDFRYQPGVKDAPGMVGANAERLARNKQKELFANGLQPNVIIVGVIGLDAHHGQAYRVRVGFAKRTDILDFRAKYRTLPEYYQAIKNHFGKFFNSFRRKIMFSNIGKNVRSLLLSDYVFFGENLRVGKDVDIEGNLADLAEFIKVRKGREDYDKRILIKKYFEYLNWLHLAYEGEYVRDSEFTKEFLEQLFKGDKVLVDNVILNLENIEADTPSRYVEEASYIIYDAWKLYQESSKEVLISN